MQYLRLDEYWVLISAEKFDLIHPSACLALLCTRLIALIKLSGFIPGMSLGKNVPFSEKCKQKTVPVELLNLILRLDIEGITRKKKQFNAIDMPG